MEGLFIFQTTVNGRLSRVEAAAIEFAFKKVFFRYLNGVGHVLAAVPSHVTEEEYRLRASDSLFRAKVTLRQLTDSWLLPVGRDRGDKIKVRRLCFRVFAGRKSVFRSLWTSWNCPDPKTPTRL